MRIIAQSQEFIQERPRYYRMPQGGRLEDELGGGVGYLGVDGMNAMPLPTDSKGNIVDVNGNIIPDTSGNPVKARSTTSTSEESVSSNTENKDVAERRVTDNILGVPKNMIWIGLAVIGGYIIYKKFIKK